MNWQPVTDWEVVIPIIPIITVEGHLVWFRKCQRRFLERRWNDGYDYFRDRQRHAQYRILPVSDIWMDKE